MQDENLHCQTWWAETSSNRFHMKIPPVGQADILTSQLRCRISSVPVEALKQASGQEHANGCGHIRDFVELALRYCGSGAARRTHSLCLLPPKVPQRLPLSKHETLLVSGSRRSHLPHSGSNCLRTHTRSSCLQPVVRRLLEFIARRDRRIITRNRAASRKVCVAQGCSMSERQRGIKLNICTVVDMLHLAQMVWSLYLNDG
jgi:hypothetical protein